ncbi:conserved Plasmodium protein, unknown function [Plasmodium vinckei vinckei]|uniref:Uncharacterized protein n=1 Tax=Plasmodium vinckei vinckei TaxID=54757 RepID=A0A449BMZ4_PLAVN|nr:conserved Plasmodium protein, unknown function [Plasmodium vinckei vinckei]VEV54827.1 conserved Plasmodium protein, unknown function [Plasmodium vinckei vinckei]
MSHKNNNMNFDPPNSNLNKGNNNLRNFNNTNHGNINSFNHESFPINTNNIRNYGNNIISKNVNPRDENNFFCNPHIKNYNYEINDQIRYNNNIIDNSGSNNGQIHGSYNYMTSKNIQNVNDTNPLANRQNSSMIQQTNSSNNRMMDNIHKINNINDIGYPGNINKIHNINNVLDPNNFNNMHRLNNINTMNRIENMTNKNVHTQNYNYIHNNHINSENINNIYNPMERQTNINHYANNNINDTYNFNAIQNINNITKFNKNNQNDISNNIPFNTPNKNNFNLPNIHSENKQIGGHYIHNYSINGTSDIKNVNINRLANRNDNNFMFHEKANETLRNQNNNNTNLSDRQIINAHSGRIDKDNLDSEGNNKNIYTGHNYPYEMGKNNMNIVGGMNQGGYNINNQVQNNRSKNGHANNTFENEMMNSYNMNMSGNSIAQGNNFYDPARNFANNNYGINNVPINNYQNGMTYDQYFMNRSEYENGPYNINNNNNEYYYQLQRQQNQINYPNNIMLNQSIIERILRNNKQTIDQNVNENMSKSYTNFLKSVSTPYLRKASANKHNIYNNQFNTGENVIHNNAYNYQNFNNLNDQEFEVYDLKLSKPVEGNYEQAIKNDHVHVKTEPNYYTNAKKENVERKKKKKNIDPNNLDETVTGNINLDIKEVKKKGRKRKLRLDPTNEENKNEAINDVQYTDKGGSDNVENKINEEQNKENDNNTVHTSLYNEKNMENMEQNYKEEIKNETINISNCLTKADIEKTTQEISLYCDKIKSEEIIFKNNYDKIGINNILSVLKNKLNKISVNNNSLNYHSEINILINNFLYVLRIINRHQKMLGNIYSFNFNIPNEEDIRNYFENRFPFVKCYKKNYELNDSTYDKDDNKIKQNECSTNLKMPQENSKVEHEEIKNEQTTFNDNIKNKYTHNEENYNNLNMIEENNSNSFENENNYINITNKNTTT